MYDAIVVGARCAGASTAMLLARKGYNVLLVDRATFPSDIPHGHFIHRQGPSILHRWGLLERIVATGCPPVSSFTLDVSEVPLTGTDLSVNGVALGYGPRRWALDAILVDAAVAAGAELREGFVVEEFVSDDNGIVGIRGRQQGSGVSTNELARVTIGADGRYSGLAQHVQAPAYESAPTLTCWYFSYWSGVPGDALEVHVRGRRVIFAFPTNDNLFALFVAWPREEMAQVREDIEQHVLAAADAVEGLADRLRAGHREERYRGASDLPNYLRKPYGPGWALVGDAGMHKDPYLALGVCDALRDAELLAEAVDSGFSGRAPLDSALSDYERRRNEATLPDYHRNLASARFQPMPVEQTKIHAAVRGDQEMTNQYLMAIEGMIPPEEFFNPQTMARLQAHPAGSA